MVRDRAAVALRRGGAITVAWILITTALSAAVPGQRPGEDCGAGSLVTVTSERGLYSVSAEFVVPQPPSTALSVLTDYERIPDFMPGVVTSVVLERAPGRAVVEQEAVSGLMMFRKRIQLQLEVLEGSDTLQFRDRSGRSFSRYEGAWRLCETGQGTRISYQLTAAPSFDVPEFLLRKLLKRDSGQMIERLRLEIATRDSRE